MKINVIPFSTGAINLQNVNYEVERIAAALETLVFTKTILLVGIIDNGWRNTHDAVRQKEKRDALLIEQHARYEQLVEKLSLSKDDVPSLSEKSFFDALLHTQNFFVRDAKFASLCTNITVEILIAALRKKQYAHVTRIPTDFFVVTGIIKERTEQKVAWSNTSPYLRGLLSAPKDNLFVLCPGVGHTRTGMLVKTGEIIVDQTVASMKQDSMYSVVTVSKLLEQKSKSKSEAKKIASSVA